MHPPALTSRTALLCAALALCLVGAGASAHDALGKRKARQSAVAPGQLRGVNLTPNWEWPGSAGMDAATSARELQAACTLGADLVRFTVKWNRLEPVQGRIDATYASRFDQVLSQASSCGIRVLVTLINTPCWATAANPATKCPQGAGGSIDPPNDPGAYGSIVARMLQRWPGIYALEVWNEPNLTGFFGGSAGDYAALANAAVAARNGIGSGTRILVGSIGAADVGYLRRLYAAGIHGYDGISIHPYDFQMSTGFIPKSRWANHRDLFEARVVAIHRAMLAAGDRSGLWLTEFGYSVCPTQPYCVSEGRQARSLADSFTVAARWRYVQGLTSYDLRDAGDNANDWNNRFGLLRRDFSPRPSFSAVRSVLRRLDSGAVKASRARRAAAKRRRH